MKNRRIINLILSGLVLAGCQSVVPSDGQEHGGRENGAVVELTLAPLTSDIIQTRSSFTWNDGELKDVELIAVTDDGKIEDVVYVSDWKGKLSFTGEAGRYYTFYVLANIGKKTVPESATTLKEMEMGISYADIERRGIPMSSDPAGIRYKMPAQGGSLEIAMTRMLARVDLSLDLSLMPHADEQGFRVKSVKICNAINSYSPFKPEVRQKMNGSMDYGFDRCSSKDLAALNAGGTVSLYAFENMQGELLPTNTDPWKKVPENIEGSDYCSYVEVNASYSSKGLRYDDITYRFYLGNNSTTNFDVKRNTIYKMVVRPTEDEIDGHRGSWKLSSSGWDDARALHFEPGSITVPSMGSATTRIEMSPEAFDIALKESGWMEDASCTMDYDQSTGTLRITNTKEISSEAGGNITATSWDGAISDECFVRVEASSRLVSIRFAEEEKEIYVNGPNAGDRGQWTPRLIVTYSDGSQAEVEAALTSSDSSIAKIEHGTVTGVRKGQVSITGTYSEDGKTISTDTPVLVYVTDPLLALTVEPDELAIVAGEMYVISRAIELRQTLVLATYPSGQKALRFNQLDITLTDVSPTNAFSYVKSGTISAARAKVGATARLVITYSENGISKSASIRLKAVSKTLTGLYLSPESATIDTGAQVQFKLYGQYDVGSDVLVGDSASWSVDNDCISQVSDGSGNRIVTGLKGGTSRLTASFGGLNATAVITVIQHDEIHQELVMTPDEAVVKAGGDVQFTATLYTVTNGARDNGRDVSKMAVWSISPGKGATVSEGNVSTSAAGQYAVHCAYDGLEAEAVLTVLPADVITHELVLSTEHLELKVGEQSKVTATWYTLTNGVRDKGKDVTTEAVWTSSDSAVAGVEKGTVTAAGEGKAEITVSYDGVRVQLDVDISQDHELVISPSSLQMKAGDEASLTAIWYSLTNGKRDKGTDVTKEAEWSSSAPGIAGVDAGKVNALKEGQTVISAVYKEMQATAQIEVEKEDIIITSIEASPDPVDIGKNESKTMSVKATWSDGSQTIIPNSECDWTVSTGSSFFTVSDEGVVRCIAAGGSGKGKVTLRSNPQLTDSFDLRCTTVLSLKASVERQDTWGGNSYPLTFIFDDKEVNATLVSISYTGGAPSGLIGFSGGRIVAKDWWGMSGTWIKAAPTYTATFTYNGYSTTVRGTMHGTTGFKDVAIADAYYSDIRTSPEVVSAYLTGSDTFDIKDILKLTVSYDSVTQLNQGYLKVGSYSLEYSVVDPTNGLVRRGNGGFSVKTNVVEVFGTITISENTYSPHNDRSYNFSTDTEDGILGTIGILTNGHDETLFKVRHDLYYLDVHGKTHKAVSPLNSPDYGVVPAPSIAGGVEPREDTDDIYTINGFRFHIQWKGQ